MTVDILFNHPIGSFISNKTASLGRTIYHNSIFCLFDDNAFKESMEELPNSKRILEGVKVGTLLYVPQITTLLAIYSLNVAAEIPKYSYTVTFFEAVLLAPIIEEMIFRIVIQNSVHLAQAGLQAIAPKCISETRVFQAITSQKGRIVLITTLFAVIHLTNAPFLAAGTLALTTTIILFPICTLAYERGGFEASWAAHITHNFISCIL